jgi:chromosome segregation ATPase
MKKKVVEIPIEEFQELVNELKKCREDKEKLKKAVEFLNEQIEEFNRLYASKSNDDLNERA